MVFSNIRNRHYPTPAFIERRVLSNIATLDDRRTEPPTRGKPARQDAAYDWVLALSAGPLSGFRYSVEADITMGRSPECELTVPIGRISRKHLRFCIDEEGLLIEDLKPSNGTRVNGQKIDGTVIPRHHYAVEIPNVQIKVLENLARSRAGDATTKHTLLFADAVER